VLFPLKHWASPRSLVLSGMAAFCLTAAAETPAADVSPSPALAPSLTAPQAAFPSAPVVSTPAPLAPAKNRPQLPWSDLSAAQKQVLAPLSPQWASLSEAQRQKWLALSKNFSKLPLAEQQTMHSRMAEWASLTPQQRTQARLNFGESQKLPAQDKKAQWEAYLALPEDEKRKLGAAQPAPIWGAAPAQRPGPADKLSHVQPSNGQPPPKGKAPGVKDLDPKTLLPPAKNLPSKPDAPAA